MNNKYIKYISIIIFSIFFLVGCGIKKEKVEKKDNIKNDNKVEIVENQVELSLDTLINALNTCNDEAKSYETLKMFIVDLENMEINSCYELYNNINNNDEGRLVNINELISNGLITNFNEEEINNFNKKIICDSINKICLLFQ